MHPPTFNISSEGYVPTETQTWRVDLPCMHTVAAEVNITISLNITTGSSSTILHFRRRKICLKEAPRPAVRVDSVPQAPTSADIFYAGAGCAGGVLLIAAIATVFCRARARKLRRARSDEQDAHAFLPDSSCKSAASYTSYRRPASLPAVAAEERARDLQQRIAELTIQRCRVRLRAVAMEGTFGRVYKGTYADEDGREQEVLVKTVAEHASQVQVFTQSISQTYFFLILRCKNLTAVLFLGVIAVARGLHALRASPREGVVRSWCQHRRSDGTVLTVSLEQRLEEPETVSACLSWCGGRRRGGRCATAPPHHSACRKDGTPRAGRTGVFTFSASAT